MTSAVLRVKIYGAGSIGNHLANASRALGWDVTVCDVDDRALQRMKNEIYPSRYGRWDESIKLANNKAAPTGGFDLILIGTPPPYHISLALEALKERPRGIMIEKPLCGPDLENVSDLLDRAGEGGAKIFVGYTHVVGKSLKKTEELLSSGKIGKIKTLDVEFREHWEGIFKAHPWLSGPQDSYLGYWKSGGGASGEHSHAINLWQHFSHFLGFGRVTDVLASVSYVKEGKADYDDLCLLHVRTEGGLLGRVVQDVVTTPSRKWARIQGATGAIEWHANYNSDGDAVILLQPGASPEIFAMPKKRPDDFIEELRHIEMSLPENAAASPLALERGLDTMRVVAAAHVSERNRTAVKIDYSVGKKK